MATRISEQRPRPRTLSTPSNASSSSQQETPSSSSSASYQATSGSRPGPAATPREAIGKKGGSGLDEIDNLFESKKQTKRKKRESDRLESEQQRKKQKTASHSTKKLRKIKLSHDRSDAESLQRDEWADDGCGGVFNNEGYTGRKVEGAGKIYKAHLFNKKGFGLSPLCPFDCDCCFI